MRVAADEFAVSYCVGACDWDAVSTVIWSGIGAGDLMLRRRGGNDLAGDGSSCCTLRLRRLGGVPLSSSGSIVC